MPARLYLVGICRYSSNETMMVTSDQGKHPKPRRIPGKSPGFVL
jgi:hypothetical protein